MNPERWQAVGELFEQALELPPGDRTGWVLQAGAGDEELQREVRSLLASHDQAAGGFFQEKVRSAVVAFYETTTSPEPVRAGPYRLVRELGRGGMGTVYLAERDDDAYRAQVAVKLVRPGMDTDFILARFRRERQTLARLQHPNIARLLDGGTAGNGLPYIVMEYIDGPRLTEWVRAGNLGIEARLHLFLKVCSAVDYAHRNFVVHRDLKPGNILVNSDGVPKLLDFGICKLLQADVVPGGDTMEVPMTPDYASPEQVNGDPVTPLSDVYSLGIVLYELLAGKLPRRFEKAGAYGVVMVQAPIRRPGEIDPRLAGDLDNIVMHALETEPGRRYASAAELADDLRRHLTHEPVSARPQTVGYRLTKFARRNRLAVATGASVVMALSAGLAVSLYEVHRARTRLDQVRALAGKVAVDADDAVGDTPGSTPARPGAAGMEKPAASDPRNNTWRRDLMLAYGHVADSLGSTTLPSAGDTAGALEYYRKAAEIGRTIYQQEPGNLRAVMDYGIALSRVANTTDEADPARLEVARQSLGLLDDAAGIDPGNRSVDLYRAIVGQTIAVALERRGDLAGARRHLLEAGRLAEHGMRLGQTSFLILLIEVNHKRALLAVASGDRSEALQRANAALEAGQKPGTSPSLIAPRALAAMGFTYAALSRSVLRQPGDAREAASWLHKCLESWSAAQSDPTFGPTHRREMREAEAALAALETRK